MLFSKTEVEKLVEAGTADEKKLASLERKLRDLEPQWSELQNRAEQLAAQYAEQDRTYSKGICEAFWQAREAKIKAELVAAIDQRDQLTRKLTTEIGQLKARIFNRNSALYGAFGSWVSAMLTNLSPDSQRAKELIAARRECEDCGSIARIVEIVQAWATKIESEPNLHVPLFRLADAVGRALAAA